MVQDNSEIIKPNTVESKKQKWWLDWLKTLIVVVLITAGIKYFIAQIYEIPSGSMEPTMMGGDGTNDRVYVDKIVYRFSDPKPGDVIVFKAPDYWDDPYAGTRRSQNNLIRLFQNGLAAVGLMAPDEFDLTKRVIAVGGQVVDCHNKTGGLKVDNKLVPDYYLSDNLKAFQKINPCLGSEFGPVRVPEGKIWVMGDNRINSADSREHFLNGEEGTVPRHNVIGKVRMIVYPIKRWGKIR